MTVASVTTEEAPPATIRAWAQEKGLTEAKRGRLSAETKAAFYAEREKKAAAAAKRAAKKNVLAEG
jgi:hypothetical protein